MAQQQANLPNTHGGVRAVINANATDAQTRLAKADKLRGGFGDFNDSATASNPIEVTSGSGWVQLTNDKLGAFTNVSYLPEGIPDTVFAANQFDFSSLSIGDMVNFRIDLTATTTSNSQEVFLRLRMAIGSPSEFNVTFSPMQFKQSGTYNFIRNSSIYMGGSDVLNNPARFEISSDNDASIVVNGWYVQFLLRGEAS